MRINIQRLISTGLFMLLLGISCTAKADDLDDILKYVQDIDGYTNQISSYTNQMSGYLNQMQQLLQGQYGFGTYRYQDFQSWGSDAQSWNSVLALAQSGGSSSKLGGELGPLAQQFPINSTLFNQTNANASDQQYYSLAAQTALAARSASQLDYDQIQNQINYQQMLQQQIEATPNVKAATDLQNRLQVENNLIQLEVLRQLALMNQQQSLQGQAAVNAAIKNAQFLETGS